MGTNRNILRPGQKERLRKGAIQGSRYYNHFLKENFCRCYRRLYVLFNNI